MTKKATQSVAKPENDSGDPNYPWRHPVPIGWKKARLGDVIEIVRGISFPKDAKAHEPRAGYVACLRTTNVQRSVEWDDLWFVPEEHVKRDDQYVRSGDILISTANSYELVGKVAPVTSMPYRATLGAFIALLRPKDDVDCKFAYYQIAWSDSQDRIRSTASTTTNISNVSTKKLSNIELAIPPLDQQKRIVAEIEKQFSRLDEAVANLKRVKANLKRYKAAVLKAAVEGRLVSDGAISEMANWDRIPIGIAIESLDQGWSPQCENESTQGDNDWGVMKTTAVQPLQYLDAENKRLPDKLKPRPHLELAPGDLLITRAGPRSRVGIACLVRATRPRIMLCDKVYRLRSKQDVALPAFLELVLNSPEVVDSLNELKTGISDSGVNLTQKRFQELLVPIPPIKVQERILVEVDRRLSLIRETEAQIDANFRRAERLRQSILAKAFSGELFNGKQTDSASSPLSADAA